MKKMFYSVAVIALAFFAGSCQRENLEPAAANGTVTYTVEVPGAVATKAGVASDGVNNVNELVYEVYRIVKEEVVSGETVITLANDVLYRGTAPVSAGKATCKVDYINNQNHMVLFWAHQADNGLYNVGNLRNVTVNASVAGNTHANAAFTGKDILRNGVSDCFGSVKLTRPVAQLNIATTKQSLVLENSRAVNVSKSEVSVSGLSASFNVATGEVSGDESVTYTSASADLGDLNDSYKLLSMNYVGFVPADGANVTVDYTLTTSEGEITNEISSVPVKRNIRTNIIGNLISNKSDYDVELDPDWGGADENVEIWDGEKLQAPMYDEPTKTWSISTGAELAWLSAYVNGTLPQTRSEIPEFDSNHTFVLTDDIRLGGNKFIPIGCGGKRFSGTFDGAGHTISDFEIDAQGKDQAALFGNTALTVVIKNLTVDGAKVVYPGTGDYYGSGLVATAYGNVTIENVTVKNSYISGNNKIAGILAHDGGVSSLNINYCLVTDCTIESKNQADGGNVGGLVGLLLAEVQHSIKNSSVTNTVINAINSSDSGKRANGEFVACVNGKNNLKLYIENCSVSGNTFSQNTVTYLSPFGKFVGGVRENGGVPTVVIDNQNVAGTAEELVYLVYNATSDMTIALTADINGKISLTQKAGVNITILGKGHKFTGGLHIWGNGAADDRSMTIKNINFDGTGLTDDEGCIYTTGAVDGRNSYACNVTIEDCTFTGAGVAAIRQNVAGERDWTIKNCTVADNMHSLLQVSNTNGELVVENCKVYSKNGANLNSTCVATFTGCEFDVRGYAVRVGVNSGGNPDATKLYTFTNCTFESENEDGDAVVIIRKDAQKATLNFVNTELIGEPIISGNTSATKISGIALPQQDNEIWYTATALVHAHWYKDKFGEGTDLVSNVWDETTGKGVITLSGPVTKIGANTFYDRVELTSISFPNSVTTVGDNNNSVFSGCTNLTTVEFGNSVQFIGYQAFTGCKNLTNVVFPESLTTIAESAFNSCTALKAITLPAGVTTIGDYAFNGITELKVYCKATIPPTVGSTPFNKWWAEIYVPAASLAAYQEAWGNVADNIYAE